MNNPSLRKALSLLAHPLSIAAILVLLINDHFLRIHYPSWITGKLGDFAWLYFSPLALAAVLAVLFPKRSAASPRQIILISIGLISGTFLLGKVSVGVNIWLRNGMGDVLGGPISLHRDPTDLVALLAAGGAYLAWNRYKLPEKISYGKGFALVVISAVLTIANAAEPDYGITCLEIEEGRLIAGNNWYQYFESRDGGFTWQDIDVPDEYRCDPYRREEIEINAPDNEQFLFRTHGRGELEESQDGGTTWVAVPGIQRFSQAEIAWLEGNRSVYYEPGPFDAVIDPGSGNLVFAMGLEGALVRSEEGNWTAVAVGEYQLSNLTLERIPGLLKYEIFLAAAYALLLPITRGIFSGTSLFQKIWLGLIWVVWLILLVFFQPALMTGYGLIVINAGVVFLALSVLILAVLYSIRIWDILKIHWVQPAGSVLLGFMAVFFPYPLWALNILPDYRWSMALSLALSLILLAIRWKKPLESVSGS